MSEHTLNSSSILQLAQESNYFTGKIAFIIGAPKCGTTVLHALLSISPAISCSEPKELDYFSEHYNNQDFATYLTHFGSNSQNKVLCEASPGYLACPNAPARIGRHFVDSRFVVMLRDPVERAISQYFFGVQRGTVSPRTSFGDFIFDAEDAFARRTIELGFYGAQLSHWMSIFPSSCFLILDQKELYENTRATLDRVCKHIGIPEIQDAAAVNSALSESSNRTNYVRFARIYRPLQTLSRFLAMARLARPMRDLFRTFFFSVEKPRIDAAVRLRLTGIYREDLGILRDIAEADSLGLWARPDDLPIT